MPDISNGVREVGKGEWALARGGKIKTEDRHKGPKPQRKAEAMLVEIKRSLIEIPLAGSFPAHSFFSCS